MRALIKVFMFYGCGVIHTSIITLKVIVCVSACSTSIPLFRDRLPGSAELKSLMHTYSLSPGLVLGMVTSSTKVLGN